MVDVREKKSMSVEASRCFNEAKTNLASASAAFSRSVSSSSYKDLHTAHTLAIKGVLAAKGGNLPPQKHKLVNICESIGLWAVMPPKLKEHLIAIDGVECNPVDRIEESRLAGLTIDEWKERLQTAPKFLFFMENHVASNPQILGGLTVS
jgi:HEPN domain-containing protein